MKISSDPHYAAVYFDNAEVRFQNFPCNDSCYLLIMVQHILTIPTLDFRTHLEIIVATHFNILKQKKQASSKGVGGYQLCYVGVTKLCRVISKSANVNIQET